MFDSPDRSPPGEGQFSLPQLARAAVYHGKGVRAESTLTVSATSLPSGAGHGVAAGAWWSLQQACGPLGGIDPGFVDWVAQRAASLGAEPHHTRAVLEAPLDARVDAPVAGTALPLHVPLLQVTAPLPQLEARKALFAHTLQLGFSAATHAHALCTAAAGRPVIDDASVHHGAPGSSTFLAWCGRVGGMSGTTHARAGWSREVPVVGVPSVDAPLTESRDAVVDADDIHASVGALARRMASWSSPPSRVRLDAPLRNDVDLEKHFLLRRALDRHGLRRARICAEVAPTVPAIQRMVQSDAPVDILVLGSPWWTTHREVRVEVRTSAKASPTGLEPVVSRVQLQRNDDQVCSGPWQPDGLLRPLYGPGRPLPATPAVLPKRHDLRAPVSPHLAEQAPKA